MPLTRGATALMLRRTPGTLPSEVVLDKPLLTLPPTVFALRITALAPLHHCALVTATLEIVRRKRLFARLPLARLAVLPGAVARKRLREV